MNYNLAIILPAFNESQVIGGVLNELKKEIKKFKNIESEIVVIDDGSTDQTTKIANKAGVTVLKHIMNRGLGASLMTGLKYGKVNGKNILVTMDSDGQHKPQDIHKIISPIIYNNVDVVIGSRFLGKSIAMSWLRKLILKGSNLITYLFFGIYSTDSQSGFRAFSKKAIQKIILRTQRMEVSSELFSQIKKNKLAFTEVPIRVIYTPYSRAKGQSDVNAIKILLKLILRLGR